MERRRLAARYSVRVTASPPTPRAATNCGELPTTVSGSPSPLTHSRRCLLLLIMNSRSQIGVSIFLKHSLIDLHNSDPVNWFLVLPFIQTSNMVKCRARLVVIETQLGCTVLVIWSINEFQSNLASCTSLAFDSTQLRRLDVLGIRDPAEIRNENDVDWETMDYI